MGKDLSQLAWAPITLVTVTPAASLIRLTPCPPCNTAQSRSSELQQQVTKLQSELFPLQVHSSELQQQVAHLQTELSLAQVRGRGGVWRRRCPWPR